MSPLDRLIAAGWLLFALSGVLFLIEGIRSGDSLTIGGSVTWLIGVAIFLVAHFRK